VPPAAAAPAPQANAEKAPSGEVQAAVLAVLSKWQAAWAGKDVEAYLGYYAKGFKPVKMNRAAWEADRRVKLNKPGPIQLNIVEPTFETEGGVLKVNFTQEYTSSNFRDKSRKRMDWVQEGGEWRIQREAAL
jgi:outer membrane protein, adhesin transport system